MDALAFAPATEIAARLHARQLSPAEAVEACLRRIERVDPQIGAFADVAAEQALAQARAIDPDDPRAFAGVPVAVKSGVAAAGLCMDLGSRLLAGHRPSHDAHVVRRLRDAGFVIVGATRMPELGILPTTEPRHGGPARNPWSPRHTPGGSSGGSAAAVAAGLVSVAHGSDGGGSLRIPAACCGLVGLKPSRGRISRGPDLGDSFLVTDGVVTRTVAESALLLDVLAGYEPGDATWAPRPVEPFTASLQRAPRRLRIAVSLANPYGVDCDPDGVRALRATAALLEELGHDVADAAPPLPGLEIEQPFIQVFGAHVAMGVRLGERLAGRPAREDEVEPLSRMLHDDARALPATGYLTALAQLQLMARTLVSFFADWDLLLTPALGARPLPIGELHGWHADGMETLHRAGRFTPYTGLWNVTGQPAISVPAGFGEDGLPVGVQLVGRPLADDTLLQVAAQLEEARPWAGRTPAL